MTADPAPATDLATRSPTFPWAAREVTWPVRSDVGPGLEGVVAATTRVVWLDPSSGHLAYRGVAIDELAVGHTFEEVAHLLITGSTGPGVSSFRSFRAELRSSRELPEDVIRLTRGMDPGVHPTRLLRAGISAQGCHEQRVADDLAGARHWREVRIVGQVAGLVADVCRHRRGRPAETHLAETSLAAGVLSALGHDRPEPDDERILDLLWILYAAHGLDAPAFTSMIVASCLADPYYTVVAGLSALRGSRVGGAGERVLAHLLAQADATEAQLSTRRALDRGEQLAGFGHRIYRMPDPRVPVLRKAAAAACRRKGREELFAIARAVEDEGTRHLAPRGVHVNINFYGALLFHLLGAEPEEVPCLYAVARTAGMVALVRETLGTIRLFRPLDRYAGPIERRLGREESAR